MASEGLAMLDGPNDPTGDRPDGQAESAPQRVVVVQVRRSLMSRLATPMLILVAAAAILSHRVKLDNWRGLSAIFGEAPALPPVAEDRPAPRPSVALSPPSPSVLMIPEARPVILKSRPLPIAIRPEPKPTGPSRLPFPDRAAKADLAWSEIRKDVDRAKMETAALEEIKRREFAEDQRLQPIREAEAAREALHEVEKSRGAFQRDLRKALSDKTGPPGQAVEALCAEHGMHLGTARSVPGTASGVELTSTARRHRIEKLRASGRSDPEILEDLARLESRNRTARGGPRSRQEVLVRAARQLLSVPLPLRSGEIE